MIPLSSIVAGVLVVAGAWTGQAQEGEPGNGLPRRGRGSTSRRIRTLVLENEEVGAPLPWRLRRDTQIHVSFHEVPVENPADTLSRLIGVPIRVSPGLTAQGLTTVGEMRGRVTRCQHFLHAPTEESGISYAIRAGAVALVPADTPPRSLEQIHRLVWEAITVLGMLWSQTTGAVPTLQELTELGDRQIAESAKPALKQIRG